MNITDKGRKADKAVAVSRRLREIEAVGRDQLLNLLSETKLDLLILALGIGSVNLHDTE